MIFEFIRIIENRVYFRTTLIEPILKLLKILICPQLVDRKILMCLTLSVHEV